ncbi:MAG: hydroxyacylglutathione hydrolase [Marinagarivorans sp.]|nr:hydroxyacylglutathione hydrolase [Marinagarivorans sp.]
MSQQPQHYHVVALPMCHDNYGWLIHNSESAWILDPGDADVVIAALKRLNLKLKKIIITHRHWDHVDGIEALHRFSQAPVYGPKDTHPHITHFINEGDNLDLDGITLDVWHTPGHTQEHLSYYQAQQQWLFCGDTLFSAGCGRILKTGNLEQLYRSLERIRQLPPTTTIYCSHEYTLNNLAFAAIVEPSNHAITQKIEVVKKLRASNAPSLPTQLDSELTINPFLRLQQTEIKKHCQAHSGQNKSDPFIIFCILREWKNSF